MSSTPKEQTQRLAERLVKIASDLANMDRDAPIRASFHAWLETQGFEPQTTPKPGSTYPGAHTQTLWDCWLAATLAERGSA